MSRASVILSIFSIAILPFFVGCNSQPAGPEMYEVSGNVTFDGAPLKEGRIRFRLTSGDQRAFEAEISDGQYSLETTAGSMQVEVRASRIVPGKFEQASPDEEPQPVGEMYIPEKYNAKTELSAEVSAGGENTFSFDLKSSS